MQTADDCHLPSWKLFTAWWHESPLSINLLETRVRVWEMSERWNGNNMSWSMMYSCRISLNGVVSVFLPSSEWVIFCKSVRERLSFFFVCCVWKEKWFRSEMAHWQSSGKCTFILMAYDDFGWMEQSFERKMAARDVCDLFFFLPEGQK